MQISYNVFSGCIAVDSLLWSYEESWWALNTSDLDCDGILGKGDPWNATFANTSEGGG